MDGIMRLEQGELSEAAACLRELDELDREFDSDYIKDLRHILDCRTLIKSGTIDELSRSVDRALNFIKRTEFIPDIASILGFAARLHVARGNLDAAEASIAEATRITLKSEGFPIDKGCRLGAAAVVAIEKARRAAGSDGLDRQARKECRAAIRAFKRNSRKCAVDLVESWKLAGHLAWYEGSPLRAEVAWRRAIAEGERLGARLELGRTLVEAGALLGERGPGPEWSASGGRLLQEIGVLSDTH
jgi:tetratricopeptide (TPR) repeat protein